MMGDYSKEIFGCNHMFDISSEPLRSTWRNGKTGMEEIAKHLDRFLIHENLVERIGTLHYWVVPSSLYDHDPIFLH